LQATILALIQRSCTPLLNSKTKVFFIKLEGEDLKSSISFERKRKMKVKITAHLTAHNRRDATISALENIYQTPVVRVMVAYFGVVECVSLMITLISKTQTFSSC
jgi:hypothetical protein